LRSLSLPGIPAIPATLWLVFETLLGIELLFANREGEVDSTVLARDDLVFHQNLPDRRRPLAALKADKSPPVLHRRQAV
jgi:hypothetical protein